MIKTKIKQLLTIVSELKQLHPKKEFTLDGRLVGDIGEIIAEQIYQIELFDKIVPKHDAETFDKRQVQIKTTMKNIICYQRDHHPDLLLAIEITKEGELIELYNGETSPIEKYLFGRKKKKITFRFKKD